MYSKSAKTIALIVAAIAVLVVVLVSSVLVNDSDKRYEGVPSTAAVTEPQETMSSVADSTEATETVVEEEVVAPEQDAMLDEDVAMEPAVETLVEAMEPMPEDQPVVPEPAPVVEEAVVSAVTEPVVEGEAQIHVVTAEGLVYNPLVVVIKPGDTVAWENMPTHDTQALEGLIPDGAEYWHSAMGENYQRTFTIEGLYVYKCTPHFGAGMGGAIIVGKPVNLEAIQAAPVTGAAKRLVKKALQVAETL